MERGKRVPAIIAFLQKNNLDGKTYMAEVGFLFFLPVATPCNTWSQKPLSYKGKAACILAKTAILKFG